MRRFFLSLVVLMAVGTAPSFGAVPSTMNYQGQLLDNIGDPVANGVYSVTFTIYDADAGGNAKWSETQNVSTASGLFSVVLGDVTPIEDSVFNGTNRYLGIQIGADPEMTPRIEFTSAAYANRISTIDGSSGGSVTGDVSVSSSSIGNAFSVTQSGLGRGGFFQIANGGNTEAAVQGTHVGGGPGGSFFSDGGGPGITASSTIGTAAEFYGDVETYGDLNTQGDIYITDGTDSSFHFDASLNRFLMYGSDGLIQSRLWGTGYGELELYDNNENDLTAVLSSGNNSGGSLDLADQDGNFWISLNAGSAQDDAVMLPSRAINALETGEEAGVANRIGSGYYNMTGNDDTLLVRTITAPASGFVLAIATSKMNFYHNEFITSYVNLKVGPTGGSDVSAPTQVAHSAPDGTYMITATVQGIFSVPAGATQFSMVAIGNAGTISAQDPQLTLLYFPTNYGLVTSNISDPSIGGANDSEGELEESKRFYEQKLENELAAIRSQLKELESKIETKDQQ